MDSINWRTRGVLFDFDGVLADSMGQHLEAWQHAFRGAGIEVDDLEFYKLEGRGVEGVVHALAKTYQVSDTLMEQLISEKKKYYNEHMEVRLFDGLLPLLASLKNAGIQMAVVTGGAHDRVDAVIDEYFPGYFQAIVTSDDVQETKPHPEPYLTGAQHLGLEPADCVIVENAPLGITAARAAGIRVIAIETTLPAPYLAEADIIVNTFNQIRDLLAADNPAMR
jgi:beta-phosphoglucomutase